MRRTASSICFISPILALVIAVQAHAQAQPTAACQTESHRQFDFWIGEWTVTNPNGKVAGQNTIKAVENGCVLQENWRSATSPFTGRSFNYYNQSAQQWEQLWLDNQGGSLKLAGQRRGNQMILQSQPTANPAGVEQVQRITWTLNEDHSVRQLWEVLVDGEVSSVAFDGLYTKSE